MRVLMISKACIVGIYQRKLEYIAREGVDLRVIVPPSWRDERGEQHLEAVYTAGYDLKVLPIAFNGNFHMHFYRGLGAQIADFQPDIVHIDEEPYNLASWQAQYHARRVGAKSLFFSWQNILRHYPPPFAWGEAWMLKQVDHALMGTDSAGHVWEEKGYRGAWTTIPQFGTDTRLFQPKQTDAPQRPFTIGFIGRLVQEKGVYDLLQAVALLEGDWQLRFIGGGTQLDALRAEAHTHGIADRVSFVGQIASTEMPTVYQGLDVLVLPSRTRPNWKEQFGRVLIEAMASGVPVIGSDSGAIPDVIGEAGLVFPEGDIHQLYGHLHRLMHDTTLWQNYHARGIAHVQQFTHEAVAQATVAVYNAMLPSAE